MLGTFAAAEGTPRGGREAERGRKRGEVVGGDVAESRQDELDAERLAKGGEGRLAMPESFVHQAADGTEGGADGVNATASPADGARQLDIVSADEMSGGLHGVEPLDLADDALDVAQRAWEPGGEAVGEQTERPLRSWTVPAGNVRASRIEPLVGAESVKPAAAFGMQRALVQSCRVPRLLGNVFLAGEPEFPPELHRPRPARLRPWRATFRSDPRAPCPGAGILAATAPTAKSLVDALDLGHRRRLSRYPVPMRAHPPSCLIGDHRH